MQAALAWGRLQQKLRLVRQAVGRLQQELGAAQVHQRSSDLLLECAALENALARRPLLPRPDASPQPSRVR